MLSLWVWMQLGVVLTIDIAIVNGCLLLNIYEWLSRSDPPTNIQIATSLIVFKTVGHCLYWPVSINKHESYEGMYMQDVVRRC
jgi:hypothetical protein